MVDGGVDPTRLTPKVMSAVPTQRHVEIDSPNTDHPRIATRTYPTEVTSKT